MKQSLSQTLKTEQNTVQLPNTHNLDTLLWKSFLEIVKTENYAILDLNYKTERIYLEAENLFFKEAWIKLQDQVFVEEDNEESKQLLRKSFDRFFLSETIKLLQSDANLLVFLSDKEEMYKEVGMAEEYIKQLQEVYAMIRLHDSRIPIDYFGTIADNVEKISKVLKSLVNQYNTRYKDIESKVDKINNSLHYDVLQICRITSLQLDPETMVCSKWFAAKKIAFEINEANLKNRKDERVRK